MLLRLLSLVFLKKKRKRKKRRDFKERKEIKVMNAVGEKRLGKRGSEEAPPSFSLAVFKR